MTISRAKLKYLRELVKPFADKARKERLEREAVELKQKEVRKAKETYNRLHAPHPLDIAAESEREAKKHFHPVDLRKLWGIRKEE